MFKQFCKKIIVFFLTFPLLETPCEGDMAFAGGFLGYDDVIEVHNGTMFSNVSGTFLFDLDKAVNPYIVLRLNEIHPIHLEEISINSFDPDIQYFIDYLAAADENESNWHHFPRTDYVRRFSC